MLFPRVSVTLLDMDEAGRRRAGEYLAGQASRHGWSVARLALEAGLDPQTVRALIEGERWPWAIKRQAMEQAVGLEVGTLELVARGLLGDEDVDPVEQAIQESELTRGNKAKLLGTYYDMIDQQQRGAS